MNCCASDALERQFGPASAAADLRRYRRRGPGVTTRMLLSGIRPTLVAGATLLDVGGGIGALHHELLDQGVARAWQVEPSAAYLRASKAEAARRGHGDRVAFVHGDLAAASNQVPSTDVVTLDRVVCCDPEYERLLGLALEKARRLFGFSYPRDRWGVRGALALVNCYRRSRGLRFRGFLHPPERMEALILARGFTLVFSGRSTVWAVGVYARQADGGRRNEETAWTTLV
jgi:magnesium-protoporphyrin O-methyltransferase